MTLKKILTTVTALLMSVCFAATPAPAAQPAADLGGNPGDSVVLKWKNGKRAVFMLEFDDSYPTQIKNVIPELTKREMVGTFYIVAGGGLLKNLKTAWEQAAANPYVVLANHTFTHKGVQNVEELETEVSQAQDAINAYYPGRKNPRLISFGQPGGVPWKVSKEEFKAVLAKHNLINRPHFYGPPFHHKSAAEMIAVVDLALKKGEMGHLDFHGVGGDWHVTPLDWFIALLDKLESERDRLWITDPISWHQYQTERKTAELKTLKSEATEIRLSLSSQADPALYDMPLSLVTRVPADWKACAITQGTVKTRAQAVDGQVRYDAVPGGGEIILQPAG